MRTIIFAFQILSLIAISLPVKADPTKSSLDFHDLEQKLERFKGQRDQFLEKLGESNKHIDQLISLTRRCKFVERERKFRDERPQFNAIRENVSNTLGKSETVIVVDTHNICTGGFEGTFQTRKALYEAIKVDLAASGISKQLRAAENELNEAKGAAKAKFDQGRAFPEFIADSQAPGPNCKMRHEREIMGILENAHKWVVATTKSYVQLHQKIDQVNQGHENAIAYGVEQKAACAQGQVAKKAEEALTKQPPAPPTEAKTVAKASPVLSGELIENQELIRVVEKNEKAPVGRSPASKGN